jgi:hypothetical protein
MKPEYNSGVINLFPVESEIAIVAIPMLNACPVSLIVPIVADACP